jgi:hypothetical protein
MTITRLLTVTTLLLTMASACASTPDAASTTTSAATPRGCMMPDTVPMLIKGTSVTVVDVDGGARLEFVTTGDVAGLRDRVTAMAAKHDRHGGMGAMGGHGMGHGVGHGMGPGMKMGAEAMGPMPASTAVAADSDGGATLTLTATDAATVEALRVHVHARAVHMQSGACSMKAGS